MARRLAVLLIASLLIVVFVSSTVYGDEWVKARPGEPTWVDTSHWEARTRWVDTSHWETHWGWFWVSSGYWNYYWAWYRGAEIWSDSGFNTCPYPGYYGWPYSEDRGSVVFYWWVDYDYWPSWHSWIADWAAAEYYKVWYQEWYWVDTSRWEWQPYSAWVSSGYWQDYQEWVISGYWVGPLHGTLGINKEPPYVFTKWHWLTDDGRGHSPDDERAHLDITITWQTDRPVASIVEYVEVARNDTESSKDRINVVDHIVSTPSLNGTLTTTVEYDHSGLATHYFVLTGSDHSKAIIYCEIPVNGFTGINTGYEYRDIEQDRFIRSEKDSGSVVF